MKAIARLGLGWLMMLAGAALMLDSGTSPSRNRALVAVEALGGFAVLATGAGLRRRATRERQPWQP